MPSPVDFMRQYRNLKVNAPMEDATAKVCRVETYVVQLNTYFMMDWSDGSEQERDYSIVTQGSTNDVWFNANKDRIRSAAMGKGAPQDYELALEWAVRSKKIENVSQTSIQAYCDDHLGIDCSGFVTNYLIACSKRAYSSAMVRNSGATSYYSATNAINDPTNVRQGDLLVFMDGNGVKRSPGHVAVVDSYVPQCRMGGNMRVVEATAAPGAHPKLLDSMYYVEQIIDKGPKVPVMILVVKRHGISGSRVSVMRV